MFATNMFLNFLLYHAHLKYMYCDYTRVHNIRPEHVADTNPRTWLQNLALHVYSCSQFTVSYYGTS